ncbi:tRNA pseudouridine synthase A [Frigoribacterium faeni]|uniref:tRNA pseudouridine synthase A n=1 Tax=Frigoribacterium faeni TaxID=145483 RepID=UPI001FAE02FD|nr:tRNA pseudouridine synthase A [Frigoribacterium faeni]MCJ0700418.1 tRNA pseudouridine synthase A [Frigoribacterium faeni]
MTTTDEPTPDDAALDRPNLTRIRLNVAYDGTNFSGWSEQPGRRTVQGEIEQALVTLFRRLGDVPTVTVAGRTDAGVHARGQVVHLDLTDAQIAQLQRPHRGMVDRTPLDAPTVLARRLNGLAGASDEIVVSGGRLAPPGFHARFGALWRRYEYRIADRGAERDPARRGHTLWYDQRLDLDLMNATAAGLLGLHDWAAYCRYREYATSIRELQEFRWRREADGVIVATVQADAFCHNLVRNLVGACVAVGEGVLPQHRAVGIRREAERNGEFRVVPAHGLTMVEVGYPPDDEVAARTELTQVKRSAAQVDE